MGEDALVALPDEGGQLAHGLVVVPPQSLSPLVVLVLYQPPHLQYSHRSKEFAGLADSWNEATETSYFSAEFVVRDVMKARVVCRDPWQGSQHLAVGRRRRVVLIRPGKVLERGEAKEVVVEGRDLRPRRR